MIGGWARTLAEWSRRATPPPEPEPPLLRCTPTMDDSDVEFHSDMHYCRDLLDALTSECHRVGVHDMWPPRRATAFAARLGAWPADWAGELLAEWRRERAAAEACA